MRFNMRRRYLFLASLALIVSAVVPGVRAQAPASARATTGRPAVVTIAHFNDVYEIGPIEGGKSGGLARVATVLSQLRRSNAPLLVTLGGDYVSPSALGTARINGEALAGRQMVDVLNATGLEWATLGNHEFDISEAAFKQRMAESKFKIVVSNVTGANDQPFANTLRTAIVPVQAGGRTIRIGIIGLVIDANKKGWVKYLPVIPSARSAIAELSGKVDAIVALTHLTLAGDAELAASVPEIDLILGGHEHENWALRRGEHFTPIIKADANVRSLAIVSMAFGATGARPSVSARLQLIDGTVKPLPSVDALVKKWTDTAFDAFRKDGFAPEASVVTLTEPLDGRESVVRNRDGKLTQIIANALQHDAGADIGIFNGGSVRIDDVLQAGPLTEYDIIRVLPFGGKVLKVSMDGALIARVLDTGLGNQGTGGFLHSSDGMKRGSAGWTLNGVPLEAAKAYTVGISDFLMTGGETNLAYLTRTAAGVHSIEEFRDIRRAVIDELKRVYR
ncbi:MAG: bifunctional metallophosphatase/5'-nucleotidase [Acidobacteria bacterium]|nr:MAG: bifunctional metallophosphatase/5'-nucleotidase [Acidobacteriota bacterium]